MQRTSSAPSTGPSEQRFRIAGPRDGLSLSLTWLPAAGHARPARGAVLYVHGATFPSGLSIAYRFGERSWRDALSEAGFDVWGFDFYGFGASDRYPEMDRAAGESAPLGHAADGAAQLERVVRFIIGHHNLRHVSLISHSWGSMPAGLFAGAQPALVDRWVLFAPIARRGPRRYESAPSIPRSIAQRRRPAQGWTTAGPRGAMKSAQMAL